jgi:hypothetical protein
VGTLFALNQRCDMFTLKIVPFEESITGKLKYQLLINKFGQLENAADHGQEKLSYPEKLYSLT